MDSFSISQCDHPQHAIAEFWHFSPKANPTISLHHASNGFREDSLAPLHLDTRALSQYLLAKIPGRFHIAFGERPAILFILTPSEYITDWCS
jgi:hypothetical protein